MSEFLTVAGIALQLFGGLVALRGLIRTHDAYAEKSVRTLAAERANELQAWFVRSLRRLLRRPGEVVVHAGTGELKVTGGGAIAVVGWGSLPANNEDAIRELDRRFRELSTRTDGLDHRIRDLDTEHRAALDELRSDLEQTGQQANLLIRQAAIEGLMGEAIGLLLVIVGGMLQAWGALI